MGQKSCELGPGPRLAFNIEIRGAGGGAGGQPEITAAGHVGKNSIKEAMSAVRIIRIVV